MTMMPKPVGSLHSVFPANVVRDYMIPEDQIPKDYEHRTFFLDLQARWFFKGLLIDEFPNTREGIDLDMALRHLAVIQGSFEPRHEHKQACVAYLMSRWFEGPETVRPTQPSQPSQPSQPPKKPTSKGRQRRNR